MIKMSDHLIFQHIPKNGGTTFNAILDQIFSNKIIYSLDPINSPRKEFESLSDVDREKIVLLKGHLRFGIHNCFSGNSEYITFLRKPTERICSYYNYVLSQPNHRFYNEIIDNNISFSDFILKFNKQDVHNAQIRFISGIVDREDLMLEKAIENICNFYPIIGLLERFDESLILLKYYYNWQIPIYEIKNRSKISNKQPTKEQIKAINELNASDIKLYEYIQDRFENQLKTIVGNKLNDELENIQFANQQSPIINNHLCLEKFDSINLSCSKTIFSIFNSFECILDFSKDVINNKITKEALFITSKGNDPYLILNISFENCKKYYILLSINVPHDTYIQIYYMEQNDEYFSEKKSLDFFSKKGKTQHLISVDTTNLQKYLRIDIGTFIGDYIIDNLLIFEIE